jgi:hypothetical protein
MSVFERLDPDGENRYAATDVDLVSLGGWEGLTNSFEGIPGERGVFT